MKKFTLCKEIAAFQHDIEAMHAKHPYATKEVFEQQANDMEILQKMSKQIVKRNNSMSKMKPAQCSISNEKKWIKWFQFFLPKIDTTKTMYSSVFFIQIVAFFDILLKK